MPNTSIKATGNKPLRFFARADCPRALFLSLGLINQMEKAYRLFIGCSRFLGAFAGLFILFSIIANKEHTTPQNLYCFIAGSLLVLPWRKIPPGKIWWVLFGMLAASVFVYVSVKYRIILGLRPSIIPHPLPNLIAALIMLVQIPTVLIIRKALTRASTAERLHATRSGVR